MARDDDRKALKARVEQQIRRMERARRSRNSLLAQSGVLGMVGLLLVVPVVAGAYLGHWLDLAAADGRINWTLVLMLAGLGVGVVNVYLFIRRAT